MFFPEIASGSLVSFKLTNVVCPDLKSIVEKITTGLELTGRVVFLSDAGEKRDHFAIIEVEGIMSPLIVPADEIRTFSLASKNAAAEVTRD
jgi:hypothetical protein